MRFILILCLYFLSFGMAAEGQAQELLSSFDSLPVLKSGTFKKSYQTRLNGLEKIIIRSKAPRSASPIPKNFWHNFREGAFTLLSGFSTSSTTGALWMTDNTLSASDAAYNWTAPLFFYGDQHTTRERRTEDDGSSSVVTEKGLYIDWSKGGYGFILQKADTIGGFSLETGIEADAEAAVWLDRLEEEGAWISHKLQRYQPLQMHYSFVVTGFLSDKSFTIISSGTQYRSLILVNQQPQAIFQSDPDLIILSKKDRVSPYLLVDTTLQDSEKADLLRLALLGRLLADAISMDYYPR